jgi:hypothetical protein
MLHMYPISVDLIVNTESRAEHLCLWI